MSPSPENLEKLSERIKRERESKKEPAYLPDERLKLIQDERILEERKRKFRIPINCENCGGKVRDQEQAYCEFCGEELLQKRFK